jgi:hypothetical protein
MKNILFASLKSMKKVVGSISQRYGSRIRIRNKMSRIPSTGDKEYIDVFSAALDKEPSKGSDQSGFQQ